MYLLLAAGFPTTLSGSAGAGNSAATDPAAVGAGATHADLHHLHAKKVAISVKPLAIGEYSAIEAEDLVIEDDSQPHQIDKIRKEMPQAVRHIQEKERESAFRYAQTGRGQRRRRTAAIASLDMRKLKLDQGKPARRVLQ